MKFDKNQVVILLVVAGLFFGVGYRYAFLASNDLAAEQILADLENQMEIMEQLTDAAISAQAATPHYPSSQTMPPAQLEEVVLYVHIKGAVEEEGLYELPADSRLGDALDLAVLSDDANLDIINLALPLIDGMEIIIPFREESTDWQQLYEENSAEINAAIAQNPSTNTAVAGISDDIDAAALNASGLNASGLININSADNATLQSLPGIGEVKAQAIIDYRNQNGPFTALDQLLNVSGIGDATFGNIKPLISIN